MHTEVGAFGITAHRTGGGCLFVWGTGLQHLLTPVPSALPGVSIIPIRTPYQSQAAEWHLGTGPGTTLPGAELVQGEGEQQERRSWR